MTHIDDPANEVFLTIHRAASTIGGNCIELATGGGERLILDLGRPLDASPDATDLLPASLDVSRDVAAVLVSHPHQDHYGLLEDMPSYWPVFCGEATEKLMRLTMGIFGKGLPQPVQHWRSGCPLPIGPFTVTPYLTDHSAFDAYMLQVDVAGKRVFYSGDFRLHGRKAALVERLMANPPPGIDVLLMEGTNIGSNKPCMSEGDLEQDYKALFRRTEGRVFVCWSAQNIDRTVTLYRACKQSGRTLVVDLYTADVLQALEGHGKIPQVNWAGIKVVITRALANMYRRKGRADFVDAMAQQQGIPARALAENSGQWVIMLRPSLLAEYEQAGVLPDARDTWSWGLWKGYLDNPDGQKIVQWFARGGAVATPVHTSGHASTADLQAFARALKPAALVPIHGVNWDVGLEGFPQMLRLLDGQRWAL